MVWMDGKAALKKTLPKSWIHTVSDFFGEAQMRHFCLSQMCFTIRLDTIEKIYTFTSFYQLVFGTSTKDTSPLPRHENISIIYPPPSFAVCYAKNFGPKGIGFGGLTQAEKKECE